MSDKKENLKRFWNALKKGWMAFAHAAGWLNTRLLLTLFYILLGIPALVLKLIRKDLLDRALYNRSSYWNDKEKIPHTTEQAKHQF